MSIICDQSLAIIKATSPLVAENAEKITATFYSNMLGAHPELFQFFNKSNQPVATGKECKHSSFKPAQNKTLADAIVAYAVNIEKLENLTEAVARICNKHCALGIQAEHYQLVHDFLIQAVGQVLGDVVTPEIANAWSEAVMALAKIFIKTEGDLYKAAAESQWKGLRDFTISDIINETDEMKSFRFVAVDGKGTCPFEPGQYISVYEKPQGEEYFAPRHYTVTSQPGDEYYQISVKKFQSGDFTGAMSSYLHTKQVGDTVKLGPVFGPTLYQAPEGEQQEEGGRVAAFVTVGAGITPTVAILPTALQESSKVAVFHGDKSPKTVPFKTYLENVVPEANGILSFSYSSVNGASEDVSCPYATEGRLTGDKIIDTLSNKDIDYKNNVDYYICAGGATPSIYKELIAAGVVRDHLHLEYFGPFVTVPEEEIEAFVEEKKQLLSSRCPFHQKA